MLLSASVRASLMPRELTGRQIRIAGEILGLEASDPSTESSLTLSASHADAGPEVQFTSDRNGKVLVEFVAYIDKTTSGEVASIEARLTDGTNAVSGTTRTVMRIHSSDGAEVLLIPWILDVTDGTAYTVQVQLRRSTGASSTLVLRSGGSYPAAVLKITGATG